MLSICTSHKEHYNQLSAHYAWNVSPNSENLNFLSQQRALLKLLGKRMPIKNQNEAEIS